MSNEIKITNHAIPATARSKNHQSPTSSGGVYTNSAPGGGVGGAPQLIKLGSSLAPSDDNVLSSLRALFEIRSRIVASDNTETELSEENTLSSLHTIAEIDAAIKLALIDIEKLYLSKTKADTATEAITFLKGLFVGNNLAHIDANGDAEVRNIVARIKAKVATLEVTGAATVGSLAAKESVTSKTVTASEQTTTLNLLVQLLASTYDLNVSHVATMMRTIIKDYVSSEAFTPGLTGEGFKISKAINGDWNLEIDNVVVRKVMTIFEMIISKVRSVNGGLVISDGNGRIKSVAETTGSPAYYVIGIEGDMQFVVDDYVRCQVFSNGHAKFYSVRVSSISNNSILVLKSEFTNGAVPAIGDDLVQMGNKTNTARQGLIYLTASEDGKPRISVMDGINSTSTVGKNKVILGCLDGITDSDFPADFQPSGYGLYAMNVFLKGIFVLRNGKSVEGEIEAAQNAANAAQAKADMVTRLFQEFTVAGGVFESKITEVKEYADGKLDGLRVGGKNLVINSAKRIDSNSYHIGNYVLSRDMLDGEELTITVWGQLAEGQTIYVGRAPSSAMLVNLARGLDGTYSGKFLFNILPAYPNDVRNAIQLYNYKQTGNLSCRIDRIKVEKGNKPTDWTPAPEDVTADAQAKANAAQAAAEAVAIAKATLAKTEASAYADDIVTEEEKRAIADAQAKLAEAKLDAQNKADAAKQAAINDAAGKYHTKSEVSSSINQKAAEINLSVTEKIESVQVGGRNYYKESTNIAQVGDSNVLVYKNKEDHGFTLVGSNPNQHPRSDCRMTNVITSNGYWTISFDLKGRQGALSTVDIDICDLGSKRFTMTSNNQWVHYEHTVNVTNWTAEVYNFVDFNSVAWDYFDFRNFKVEKGNKATDWTPAPEDVQSQITENKAQIQVLSDQIALKVSNDTFNALGNRVSAAESTLSVQANQIASKVSQNDFNTLGQRVGSAESAITQQATQITAQVTAVNDLTGRVSSAELALNPNNIWLGLTAKVDGAIELKVKTGISVAGNEVNIFGTTILNGNLIAGIISATNITTGKLTVTDGAKIGGMVIENNTLKGGSIVLTEGAKIGGFTVNGNSLTSSDSTGKVMIGDNMIRFLRINENDSASMLAIRNDNGSVLSLYSHGATGRCLGIQAQSSAIAIESAGSHLFKQRAGEVWNAPGVLWCGHYSCSNWNPTLVRSWGDGLGLDAYGRRMVPTISRSKSGCYTITHNLGHVDYFVHAIGNAQIRDNWNWWNTTVGFLSHAANSFALQFKDDGGGEKDPAEFQVMIFGRNKW